MNHLHLQETAKHYAKLAEEAQKNLEQEQELNEGLIGILDVLCEELGIDLEDLLNEDVQTDERDKEMEDEIERIHDFSGKDPRVKSLRKQQRKERASKKIIDVGGRTIGTIGQAGSMEDAERDVKLADKNLARSKKRGHDSSSDRTAVRAADARSAALFRGQQTHTQQQQEKRLGIKPSLGKRIKRAWRKWRGTEITPTDVRDSDNIYSGQEKY